MQAFILSRPLRLAIWLIVGGAMLHFSLATSAGLTPDEAHYALYGAHLDWSYFDHPGLVGWLQAPFAKADSSDLRMRIVPMASWILAAAMLCALCRKLSASTNPADVPRGGGDDLWAVAFLFLSPLPNLLGVVLVPDSLLMPLVPAAMLATWELREPTALNDWRRWLALALVLGLCLLAKYTGAFVAFGSLDNAAGVSWISVVAGTRRMAPRRGRLSARKSDRALECPARLDLVCVPDRSRHG